jgi:nucleotide-binding universal stress UspA family protein
MKEVARMVRSILVPLDGSELSEGVLPYVHRIAVANDADVELLSIADPLSWGEFPTNLDPNQVTKRLAGYLNATQQTLEAEGLRVRSAVVFGREAETILSWASDHDADLIAMSTHGRSGVSRWALGSVTDKVLHGTHRPLLVVRATGSRSQAPEIKRIIVPLDGSELSASILPFVEKFAAALDASLLLHTVVPSPPYYMYPGPEMATPAAGAVLEGLVAAFKSQLGDTKARIQSRSDLDVVSVVTVGATVDTIVSTAREEGADLIAIATHGRSGIGRWVLGSVADGVVRRSHLPCLVVRPTDVQDVELSNESRESERDDHAA